MPNLPYDQEGDNRLGPNLQHHREESRRAKLLSAMKGADFVWERKKLDASLQNPMRLSPATT
jgi:cytochrome c2